MHFTDDERVHYKAEEAVFKQCHGECHAVRHSVSVSLITHCGECCPPLGSPLQTESIARLLGCPTPHHEHLVPNRSKN
jgi:hypothetical protein